MSQENLNSVDAGQEDVVDSQKVNPLIDDSGVSTEKVEDDSSKTSEAAEPKQNQSKEENDKYAAARKEAERQAREHEAKAKDAEAKHQRDLNIARKYSGEYGVFSEEDIRSKYDMSLDEFEDALFQNEIKQAGIDPTLINQLILRNPLMKEVEQYHGQLKQQRDQEQVKRDIEILHNEVPGTDHIKTIEDLFADPKWKEIHSFIQRGYEMPDAYFKVYKNDIEGNKQKNVVKSTIADIADRARRGVEKTGDNDIDPQAILSKEGLIMAREMGVNPKNVARRLAQKLKQ